MSTTTETTPDVDTSVLYEIEEKVVTGVTLSDLIRKGSQDTMQATGWGQGLHACALSAAGIAAQDLGMFD